jgi:predicted phage terminase large subunit-like protein
LYKGGIRSGKTYGGALKVLTAPANSTVIIAAPSYENARNGALKTLLEIVNEIQQRSGMSILARDPNLSPPYRLSLIGNREYVFFSEKNFNLVRGMSASMVWIDEAGHMQEKVDGMNTVFTVAIGRLNAAPGQIILTTSPNHKLPWSSDIFRDNANDPDFETIHATTLDNHFLSRDYTDSLRKNYTREMYEQEVLGLDINPSGALFRREWLRVGDVRPHGAKWFRYWDLATSTKQSADYTASVRCCLHEGVLYIADGIHMRAEWPDVRRVMISTMRSEENTTHGIEKAMNGLAAVQELRRVPELASVPFRGIDVKGDKVQRAMPWAGRAEAGAVRIVAGAWARDFIDEVVAFPSAAHDDYVDAVSGAVGMLSTPKIEWSFA